MTSARVRVRASKDVHMLAPLLAALTLFVQVGAAQAAVVAQPMLVTQAQPQPTQAQVQAALKAANLSLRQKRALKPMVDTYKSQVANAPNAQAKEAATQQLIASMKTVLSPAQQAAFKESLMNQMAAAPPS
jgi:hypothetical protein